MKLPNNWRTTLAGVAAIIGIAAKVATTGHFDLALDGPAIAAGIGLIAAKDSNVTGGTVQQ